MSSNNRKTEKSLDDISERMFEFDHTFIDVIYYDYDHRNPIPYLI